MTEDSKTTLQELNSSLQIRSVQFLDVHSKRPAMSFQQENVGTEAAIGWSQQFADDDPLILEDGSLVFRPKYSFNIKVGEKTIFEATMIAGLLFSVENRELFEKCWEDDALKKLFLEKQIMRLMWTILRQQLMDCMSRHSLPPVPLPWIV